MACQTGVRSLSACKSLEDMGYGTVAWLQGGLEKAKAGELPTVPPGKDPRCAPPRGRLAAAAQCYSWGWWRVRAPGVHALRLLCRAAGSAAAICVVGAQQSTAWVPPPPPPRPPGMAALAA